MVRLNSLISLGRLSANLRSFVPVRKPKPFTPGQTRYTDPSGQKWVRTEPTPGDDRVWRRESRLRRRVDGVMTDDQMRLFASGF